MSTRTALIGLALSGLSIAACTGPAPAPVPADRMVAPAAITPAAEYRYLVRAVEASTSVTEAIETLCGPFDPARQAASAYADCGQDVIVTYGDEVRRAELRSLAIREAALARRAGLDRSQRISIPTADGEISMAWRHVDAIAARGDLVRAPRTSPGSPDGIVERAGRAIDRAAGQGAATPPERNVYFVARLLEDAAEGDAGASGTTCIADLPCETGAIASLISVDAWCEAPGGVTETSPGWGVAVQRYRPSSAAEEKLVVEGDEDSDIHVISDNDDVVFEQGLDAMADITLDGERAFFTSYESFWKVNTERLGCSDSWSDSARHPVQENTAAVRSK